ncbi:MAG: hypothetical protein ABFE07_29210 [Armatimonadia bacterium]
MIRVSKLNYNLHLPAGVTGFQQWFADNITGAAAVLDVHIDVSGMMEVVVWNDGT